MFDMPQLPKCPYLNMADGFMRGEMSKEMQAFYSDHVNRCEECAELLETMHDLPELFPVWESAKSRVVRRIAIWLDQVGISGRELALHTPSMRGELDREFHASCVPLPDDRTLEMLRINHKDGKRTLTLSVNQDGVRQPASFELRVNGQLRRRSSCETSVSYDLEDADFSIVIDDRVEIPFHYM